MTIKNFKEMICPVCGLYYFADDCDYDKKQPNYKGKGEDSCIFCGWKYDLYQYEHPDISNLTNKLSLNEYKKWYKSKIKEDPNYTFTMNSCKSIPHMCPVCGKYKFEKENSFDICDYCGWEDDGVQSDNPNYSGGANALSLNDYRKFYKEKIKKDPKYKWIDEI